jgi:hypothetical protein
MSSEPLPKLQPAQFLKIPENELEDHYSASQIKAFKQAIVQRLQQIKSEVIEGNKNTAHDLLCALLNELEREA